jgi:hypothetical protein
LVSGTWNQVPLPAGTLGRVISATYSYRDGRLWVLDEDPTDDKHERLRVLRVEAESGGSAVVLASTKRGSRYDFRGLVTAMDGKIILFASSERRQKHRLAVLSSPSGGVYDAAMTKRFHRALSTPPIVDVRGTQLFYTPGPIPETHEQEDDDDPGPVPDGQAVAATRILEQLPVSRVRLKDVEELLQ